MHLTNAGMRAVDFTGARISGATFNGSRMRGAEPADVEISGELENVVVNGVDIAPLVDAELNRRMPERAKMRPRDADGFREAPKWDNVPWDRDVRPSLDEVLAVRRERQAMVRQVVDSLTDDQLASEVTRTEPGWPVAENFPFKDCLRIVLNEEWEHRLYAERDLTALEKEN